MDMPISLIVEADEPALFYRTVSDAEIDLEPYDVKDGVYTAAFGPNGEIYDISTNGDVVMLTQLEGKYDVEGLKRVITRFLNSIGKMNQLHSDEPIAILLEKCTPFIQQP